MLSTGRQWWHQFPAPLRELATVRLVASFGAGGVLYLTPMVFHQADFSASQVGSGLAVAALAGTLGRFASGWLLDLGLTCGLPVLLAGLCGFLGDALLLGAHQQQGYVAGQVLLGLAGGLYWPAVELAVRLVYAVAMPAGAGNAPPAGVRDVVVGEGAPRCGFFSGERGKMVQKDVEHHLAPTRADEGQRAVPVENN